jgi:hypothetical protein
MKRGAECAIPFRLEMLLRFACSETLAVAQSTKAAVYA